MAKRLSAGLLVFRVTSGDVLEVLLVHMGGPFWQRKDERAWSIPKGEYDEGEDPLEVAMREFEEELGRPPLRKPKGRVLPLGSVRQAGGKVVTAWALEGDFDVAPITSNTFTIEWPRGSGRMQTFPEVDRAEWFDTSAARQKLVAGQVGLIDLLQAEVRPGSEGSSDTQARP